MHLRVQPFRLLWCEFFIYVFRWWMQRVAWYVEHMKRISADKPLSHCFFHWMSRYLEGSQKTNVTTVFSSFLRVHPPPFPPVKNSGFLSNFYVFVKLSKCWILNLSYFAMLRSLQYLLCIVVSSVFLWSTIIW